MTTLRSAICTNEDRFYETNAARRDASSLAQERSEQIDRDENVVLAKTRAPWLYKTREAFAFRSFVLDVRAKQRRVAGAHGGW